MPVPRAYRRLVACLLAFCVVFAQTAAAAYACQRLVAAEIAAVVPCAAHLADEWGQGVDVAPLANGNVCAVHCEPVSLPDVGSPELPSQPAVIAWRLPMAAVGHLAAAPVEEFSVKRASPPPRTLYARLLI